MADVMVFVLHAAADEAYASSIAAGLTSSRAMAVNYDAATNMRFGRGSICLALCTRAPGALAGAERTLAAAPGVNAAVCQVGDAPISSLASRAAIVRLRGDVAADTAALAQVIADIGQQLVATTARRNVSRAAPNLSAHGATGIVDPDRADARRAQGLAMRSASGVALTLAIVGAVVPSIGQRAMATDTGADPTANNASPPLAGANVAPLAVADEVALPEEGAVVQTIAVSSPTPHLDHWLSGEAAEAPAPPPSAVARTDLIDVPVYAMLAPIEIADDIVLVLPNDQKADLATQETPRGSAAMAPAKPKAHTAPHDA